MWQHLGFGLCGVFYVKMLQTHMTRSCKTKKRRNKIKIRTTLADTVGRKQLSCYGQLRRMQRKRGLWKRKIMTKLMPLEMWCWRRLLRIPWTARHASIFYHSEDPHKVGWKVAPHCQKIVISRGSRHLINAV